MEIAAPPQPRVKKPVEPIITVPYANDTQVHTNTPDDHSPAESLPHSSSNASNKKRTRSRHKPAAPTAPEPRKKKKQDPPSDMSMGSSVKEQPANSVHELARRAPRSYNKLYKLREFEYPPLPIHDTPRMCVQNFACTQGVHATDDKVIDDCEVQLHEKECTKLHMSDLRPGVVSQESALWQAVYHFNKNPTAAVETMEIIRGIKDMFPAERA
jgi:hypothetical protein